MATDGGGILLDKEALRRLHVGRGVGPAPEDKLPGDVSLWNRQVKAFEANPFEDGCLNVSGPHYSSSQITLGAPALPDPGGADPIRYSELVRSLAAVCG
jgi:hypothetical protein